MKKLFLLPFLILMIGCTDNSTNVNSNSVDFSNSSEKSNSVKRNEKCMPMNRFKVFQVLGYNYALANECRPSDNDYCSGAVVLLTPQKGVDYYDDMFVRSPKDKCAVQEGVYVYETKASSEKTVPRIHWWYEYAPRTKEETMNRLNENMDETLDNCLNQLKQNKKYDTHANRKKCECGVEFLAEVLVAKDNRGEIRYSNWEVEDTKNGINKKCGKLPVDFW